MHSQALLIVEFDSAWITKRPPKSTGYLRERFRLVWPEVSNVKTPNCPCSEFELGR